MSRRLNFQSFIIFLGILAIFFLLVLRFDIAMRRFFDADEFRHLFRAFLLSRGRVPYRDFGYAFSPLLPAFFAPFFLVLKEGVAIVFLARGLNFLIFLSISLFLFLIAKEAFNLETGVLAVFFWVFLPIGFDKTIEIRPDHLAMAFWLASFLFLLTAEKKKSKRAWLFWSGFCFGFSVLVLLKTAFGYPGLLACLLLTSRGSGKRKLENLFIFHWGALVPLAILTLIFLILGNFNQAIYSIFIMPYEVSRARSGMFFNPVFPFVPNDAFYGVGGYSLPWYLSNLALFIGAIGLVKQAFQTAFEDYRLIRLFLLFSFLSFALMVFAVIHLTLVQNYLPLFALLCLAAADFLVSLGKRFLRKQSLLWLINWALLLSIFSFAFWQSVKAHSAWENDWQVWLIKDILTISEPDDLVFDMTGYHLYRESGYTLCCEVFPQFENSLSQPLPNFIDELKRTQTKFVIQTSRLEALGAEEKAFIEKNYSSSRVEKILVAD